MKKRYLVPLLFLVFLVTLCLSACAADNSENNTPTVNYDKKIWVYYKTGEPYKDSSGYTHVPGGYKVAASKNFASGKTLLPLPSSEDIPAGHRFTGYYTYHRTDVYDPGVKVYNEKGDLLAGYIFTDKTVELEARYEPITYSILLNAGEGSFEGGSSESTLSVTYGNKIGTLPVPKSTAPGYDFDGWFTEDGTRLSNGEIPIADTLTADGYNVTSEEIKMSAVYKIRELTVTIDYRDPDTDTVSYTLNYGDPLRELSDFYKDTGDKDVIGWTVSQGETALPPETVTESITVYAVWNYYKNVSFTLPGGKYYEEKIYSKGEEAILLPKFDMPGYKLISWHPGEGILGSAVEKTRFDSLTTLYTGNWKMTDYEITFSSVGNISFEPIRYFYGDTTALPIPTAPGYTFDGWVAEDYPKAFFAIPEDLWGDKTLMAKMSPCVYTVNLNSGVDRDDVLYATVTYGSHYTIAPPEREGYVFIGWFDAEVGGNRMTDSDGKSISEWFLLENGKQLYARWEKLPE